MITPTPCADAFAAKSDKNAIGLAVVSVMIMPIKLDQMYSTLGSPLLLFPEQKTRIM